MIELDENDNTATPVRDPHTLDTHMTALGQVASAMKDHLMTSGVARTTWGDYLRVLERVKSAEESRPRVVEVRWINSEQKRQLEEHGKLND